VASNTRLVLGALFASTLMTSATAWAGGPVELTNAQLDHITAGAATVAGSVDAVATGLLALTTTNTSSIAVGGGSAYPQQPGYTNDAAAVDGTAVSVGSNFGQQGAPPSSSTSVKTAGAAVGNQVTNVTTNYTGHFAGGVTIQSGWTFVYGGWSGL
jgi:hypothetical protein